MVIKLKFYFKCKPQSHEGPFLAQVDAMATPHNTKCTRFICPFAHPMAVAVDFMTADLNRWRNLYIFPPVKLISKVLWKMETYQGSGVIICPISPQAIWWAPLMKITKEMFRLTTPPVQWVQGTKVEAYQAWSKNLVACNF